MTSQIDRLGRRLANLEDALRSLARSNNLGHSSFDGGAIIQNGADGSAGSIFGVNYDGTNGVIPVTSPPPPTPAWTNSEDPGYVAAVGVIGGIRVRWAGEWEGGAVAPLGFGSIEVHVSDTPNFSALLFATMKTSILSPRGGEVLIPLPPGTYYVKMVCRTTAGRAGQPSQAYGPVVSTQVMKDELGFDIDELAGNKVFRGSTTPVGTTAAPLKYGDLWLKTPDNVAYQWTPGASGAADSWVVVQDQNIVKALNDAADAAGLANSAGLTATQARDLANTAQGTANTAQTTANTANTAAQAAKSAADLAQSTASGKITVYRQASAPVGGTYAVNDLWLDTGHNNQLFAWSGGAWVASDDQRIATALTNASSAQTVAGAKTTLYAQVSAPATTGRVVGDTWIDTSNSNKVYVWNGTAWSATLFGLTALSSTVTARALGSVTTYRQTTAPTGTLIAGDLWIDSTTNTLYSYSGTAWVKSQDTGIQQALTNAATAQSTASSKITSFYQTSAPATGMATGDFWLDTGNGNKLYRYSGTAWVLSQDTAIQTALTNAGTAQATADRKVQTFYRGTAPTNPTDAIGTGDLWIDTANGNKLSRWSGTAWVITQDTAIQTALTTANGKTTTFYQISAPATTGRVTGDLWVDTDDGNKIYTWTGSAWAATLLSSQALNVTARQLGAITIFRQASAPASGVLDGDYWLDSANGNKAYLRVAGVWTVVQDAAVTTALTNAATAQATADGKAVIYYQTSAPTGQVAADVGDQWVDTDDAYVTYTWSGTAWVKNAISTSSFQPNSLVVSQIAATGSITAALLESILVLASEIVAGDPLGDHSSLKADGLHVYQSLIGEGITEVGRMGTSGNDFFSWTNASGQVVASVSDIGEVSAAGVVTDYLTVAGTDLQDSLSSMSSGVVARLNTFQASSIANIIGEYGIVETAAALDKNRAYLIIFNVTWTSAVANDECYFRIRYTSGIDGDTLTEPATPTVPAVSTSPQPTAIFYHTVGVGGRYLSQSDSMIFVPPATTRYRFLLSASRGVGTGPVSVIVNDAQHPAQFTVIDLGPAGPVAGGFNNGGGTLSGGTKATPPPTTTQQYITGSIAPFNAWRFRGDGSLRQDTSDVVQGYDPSGYNGDGRGHFGFNIPNITGTVNRVDITLVSNHTYYNAGGTAILNVSGSAINTFAPPKLTSDWYVGGIPNVGTKTVSVPASWLSFFKNRTQIAITAGPGGGTNEQYYCRFTWNSARLKIWYTQ